MRALLFTAAAAALLLAAPAFAQDDSEGGDVGAIDREAGPLRERIKPVSGHLFLKAGRFEISPAASVSVRDAFFTKFGFGGSLAYHFTETLALGARGAYALDTIAGSAQICTVNATDKTRNCRSPTYAELDGVAPGQITLLGGLDLQWAPIYGKLSVLAEQFLHFDIYGILGGLAVMYRGPPEAVGGSPLVRFAPGLNAGAGMRFFLNRWLTVRGELRDMVYSEKILIDPINGDKSSLRNQLIFEVGISMFLPTNFSEP
jgi:outer membrane beta-barrel protein